MNQIYQTTIFGSTYRISADFARAEAPVMVEAGDGRWGPSAYQVATFRHSPRAAMRAIIVQDIEASGDDPKEFGPQISEAVAQMTSVDG